MNPEAHEALQAAWERPAELLASHAGAEVYHADWRALLDVVRDRGGCDALIVDAPYSERTHAGHDGGAADANGDIERPDVRDNRVRLSLGLGAVRRHLNYGAWDAAEASAFVEAWAPIVRGWFVSLTDHELAPDWARALEAAGRYAFSPIACVEPGSRVRLSGDGPSQWSCWAVVARPRAADFARWGALPGAYVVPSGCRGAQSGRRTKGERLAGGKPLWLMERLVEDYTSPGDLIVDPCCGAATTLVAAQRTNRRSIGGDSMREHAELAAKRVSQAAQQHLFGGF